MPRAVKTSRRYDSSRRREAAEGTRHRILVAAREQFLSKGYAATTITDIATAAGVANQTLYTVVGGKAQLLKHVVDTAIAGDEQPVAVADRPFTEQIHAEPDGRRKLTLFAQHLRRAQERSADLDPVIRAAADTDPMVARLSQELDTQRITGMRRFAGHLRDSAVLRRGLPLERAADILAAHMDSRLYLFLVRDRRWTGRQYENWYVDITAAALLARHGDDPAPGGRRSA